MTMDTRVFVILLSAYLIGGSYVIAAEQWHLISRGGLYLVAYNICYDLAAIALAVNCLRLILKIVVPLVKAIHAFVVNSPRLVCTVRAALRVWDAWDDPAIAARRDSLKRRAFADGHEFEQALLDAARRPSWLLEGRE